MSECDGVLVSENRVFTGNIEVAHQLAGRPIDNAVGIHVRDKPKFGPKRLEDRIGGRDLYIRRRVKGQSRIALDHDLPIKRLDKHTRITRYLHLSKTRKH